MKKKTIEKIPYLGLPRMRKTEVKYIAVTAVREIEREQHLFVEVYRNQKDGRKFPTVRIILTGKDFGTYCTETETWSRKKIRSNTWGNEYLIWQEDKRFQKNEDILARENILYSKEDWERIRKFTGGGDNWKEEFWWKCIDMMQRKITQKEHMERSERRRKRRIEALHQREMLTPELPEERILQYADTELFREEHHLYYKKRRYRAEIACSKCGGISEGRWKEGESYESQFLRRIQEPRQGQFGTCPLCGTHGEYKCQGKISREKSRKSYLFLGQKYKEKGMVMRYVEVVKIWQLGIICGEKGPEMHNASEELSAVEVARAYFMPGEKTQIDYHKHDLCIGEDFWDDCNMYGNAIKIESAPIMWETCAEMQGTMFQYSMLWEYRWMIQEEVNPVDYLERYTEIPQIEMLVKMGLTEVVRELIRYRCGIVAHMESNRIDAFLGIRKEHVKLLTSRKGEIKLLRTMQMEKRMNQRWTDEQIEKLAQLEVQRDIHTVTEYMSIQQFLNRVEKYAGCGYGNLCGIAEQSLKHAAVTYIDYLNMRNDLEYDLTNTVYLFPRDLAAAHEKMVKESNQKEAEQRMQKVKEWFPLIKRNYRKLRERFYGEDDEWIIRPAKDAGEIVLEGRRLHHCVGRDSYLRKHNDGISVILFLRHKDTPKIPYITVEISMESLDIVQWYGANNKKPDEKRIEQWLAAYIAGLKQAGKEEQWVRVTA